MVRSEASEHLSLVWVDWACLPSSQAAAHSPVLPSLSLVTGSLCYLKTPARPCPGGGLSCSVVSWTRTRKHLPAAGARSGETQ